MTLWSDIATWRGPVLHHSGTIADHMYVVVHTADGSFEGTIAWQKSTASDNSSHFIVAKDGRIAQVNDTANKSGAQKAGNPYSISIENEGNENTPLTPQQIEANARILAKAHQVHGVPLQLTGHVGTRGLGHHSMGAESGVDWGHSLCPGNIIKGQKPAILARAVQIVNGVSAASETSPGAGMDCITVTNIPAGTLDATGAVALTGGQYLATPRGLLSLTGNEFFSQSVDAQNARMTLSYPRAVVYCKLLSQEPIDVEALAVDLAAQFPQGSITAQVILDAIHSQDGHDAFVAYAEEGANKAEDS
jgi:hypothetical protein